MNRIRLTAAAGVTALALTGAVTAAQASEEGAERASAAIVDLGGTVIGAARFTEDGTGRVHVNVKVAGLTPGRHGIHIHDTGSCANGFAAAGGHHNPLAAPHGDHAGDLPNLIVNGAGRGHLNAAVTGFTLSGGLTGAFDTDGSAIVIHAAPDDFVAQPTGNSGGRVACGVLVPG